MSNHAGMEDRGGSDADARREQRHQERQRLNAQWNARLDQLRPLSFEELTQIIETGIEFDRAVAIDALGEKDDGRALSLLLDILEHTEDDHVRNRAAVAFISSSVATTGITRQAVSARSACSPSLFAAMIPLLSTCSLDTGCPARTIKR